MERFGSSGARSSSLGAGTRLALALVIATGPMLALAQESELAQPQQSQIAQPQQSRFDTSSDDIVASDLLRVGVDQSELKPGEFVWLPAAQTQTDTPLMVIVNLGSQRAYVYRDGEPIGVTTVSTGRPGRETPTGTFEILAKERMHHSNLYDNAPMPFMQRLTWSGLSLHAGHLPGHPASHGCIRLPAKFAEQLYGLTQRGEFVVVSDDGSAESLARAELQTPMDLLTGTASTIRQVIAAVGPAPLAGNGGNGDNTLAQDRDTALSLSQ